MEPSRRRRNARVLALPAALALVAAACNDDNGPDLDLGSPDTDQESGTVEDGEQESSLLLPAGISGEVCQAILEEIGTHSTGMGQPGTTGGQLGDDEDDGLGAGTTTDDDDGGFGTDDDDDDGFGTDDDDDGFGTDDDDNGFGTDDDEDDGLGAGTTTDDDDEDNGVGTTDDQDDTTGQDTQDDLGQQDGQQRLRDMTTVEALQAIPALSQVASAIQGIDVADQLDGGEVTIFAPVNDDFDPEGPMSQGQTGTTGTQQGTDDDGFGTDDDDNGFGTDDDDDGFGTDDEDVTDDDAGATDDDATDDTGVTGDGGHQLDEQTLRFHIAGEGALDAQQLLDQGAVATLAEDDTQLEVTAEQDRLTVSADGASAEIICASIETADGYIHVLDQPLDVTTTQDDTQDGTEDDGTQDDGTQDDTQDNGTQDDVRRRRDRRRRDR